MHVGETARQRLAAGRVVQLAPDRIGQCLRRGRMLKILRNDEFARQDVRQADPGLVAHVAHDLPRGAHHLVGDHHRLLEQRHFQRRRPRSDQHRVGRGNGGMRLAVDQAHRHVAQAGLVQDLGVIGALALARHRRDEYQARVALGQQLRRRHERFGQVLQLAHAAARHDRHHPRIVGDVQLRARGRHVGLERNHLGQRMPDIGHRHAGGAVDRFLEGKDHQHVRDGALDLLDASAAPGPDLGADEVDRRDAFSAQLFLQAQVEARVVGADEGGRALAQQAVAQRVLDALDLAVARNDLEQAAHGERLDRDVAEQSLLDHAWAADAVETHVRQLRTQARHEARGEHVAGHLAGDHR